MATEVYLTGDLTAVVDDADAASVLAYQWQAHRVTAGLYASRKFSLSDGRRRRVHLHQFVVHGLDPAPDGTVVDHVNGDGLDCRRANLRCVPYGVNNHNLVGSGSCPHLGVTRVVRGGVVRYQAQIGHDGERRYLGKFSCDVAAALAYDAAALEIYGEYARTNLWRPDWARGAEEEVPW